MDPYQFVYSPNKSPDDAITLVMHAVLTHLDRKNKYVRMLFIDYISAVNTIIPTKLIPKLTDLGLIAHLCNWILEFLTSKPQMVKVGNSFSSTVSKHRGSTGLFSDNTTILGLITKGYKSAYRD
ncbi:hypothetical protein P4O66_010110, partial [Electrophorus voltai]